MDVTTGARDAVASSVLVDYIIMDDRRRLSFGGVAELYDRSRPSYPPALVDAVLEFAGAGEGDRALEVGAGTGKATVLFLERGATGGGDRAERGDGRGGGAQLRGIRERDDRADRVRAVAPRRARRFGSCSRRRHGTGSSRTWASRAARAALEPGGALAVFWNRPDWGATELARRARGGLPPQRATAEAT